MSPAEISALRERAELVLRATAGGCPTATVVPARKAVGLEELARDLDIHVIELELQHEELARRHAELEAARDRYQQLFEHAPVGYLTLELDGTVTEANERAAALLGVPRGRLVGTPLDRHVPADQALPLARHLARSSSADGTTTSCELVLIGAGGARHQVRIESAIVPATGASPVCIRTVLIEGRTPGEREEPRPDRAVVEPDALHAQRLEIVGRLGARLAHETRNVAGVMRWSASAARRQVAQRGEEDCAALPHVARLEKDIERLESVATQVLALSRRHDAARTPEPIDGVVEDMHDLLQSLVAGNGVEVLVETAAPDARVLTGRGWIEQILLNLALNGRDALDHGGRLSIRTRLEPPEGPTAPGGVALVVADTGRGMSTDTASRLFRPFFTTKGESGTGLGLDTVRDLVARMDGRITVSSAPDRGTTFAVHLPCTAMPRHRSDRYPVMAGGSEGPWTVLVVEDERLLLLGVSERLRRAGHRVLAAESAERARALIFGGEPIDVLLADVFLPGCGGRAIADVARARLPSIAVLFMSALPREQLVEEGWIHPREATIEKPFTEHQLSTRLAELVGQARRGAKAPPGGASGEGA